MDSSKEHKYNDPWKKALEEADITPPAQVWENIEAILDQDKKVKSVWWSMPKIWYAAASVVGLLVVGSGLYRINQNETDLLTKDSSVKKEVLQDKGISKPSLATNATEEEITKIIEDPANALASGNSKKGAVDSFSGYTSPHRSPVTRKNAVVSKSVKSNERQLKLVDLHASQILDEASEAKIARVNLDQNQVQLDIEPTLLTPIAPSLAEVYVQKRFVFYKNENNRLEEVDLSKIKTKEYWAGIGFAPGVFNPNVNIKSSPQMYSTAFVGITNERERGMDPSSGKSTPDLSFSFQAQGGVRLSKHWSLESGIGYLQGNSTYEGGGYLLNVATSGSVNALELAIQAVNKSLPVNPMIDESHNSVHVDVSNSVRNNYQYLQVPLQAGFTLNPDGKLSYALLGGVTANVFLKNQIESVNGRVTKTTVSDDVYRPLGVGASTGLRLKYKVSDSWKATLTGSYIQSLSSGFKANQQLESHPNMYGITWGVQYSF